MARSGQFQRRGRDLRPRNLPATIAGHGKEGADAGADVEDSIALDAMADKPQTLGPHLLPSGIVGQPAVIEMRVRIGGGDFALGWPRVHEPIAAAPALNDIGVAVDRREVGRGTDITLRNLLLEGEAGLWWRGLRLGHA